MLYTCGQLREKIIYCVLLLTIVLTTLPQKLFAQPSDDVSGGGEGAGIAYNIESYLPFNSLEELIVAILRIFITIATPIIVLFIMYAGFKYVTARGNVQQVQEATRALTYAIIGAVLIIGAVAISEIISNTIGAFQA